MADGGGQDDLENNSYEDEDVNEETQMETESDYKAQIKPSTSLQLMLASISEERNKDVNKMVSEDCGFVMVTRDSFWVNIFKKHFLEAPDDTHRDDLLFYVRKNTSKSKFSFPQTEIEVFRKSSTNQPVLTDPEIDMEETVYLNLILQHFEYQVTCAICSRTGEKELQILRKFTQKVYASPSRRSMDSKGTEEEITYPNIFFTVDNFEEAFADIVVRDSEMVCVELVARDRLGTFQGVIFLGSIRYDALKKVYDARGSVSNRMAQRMSFGWFKNQKRVEFVRMRGPSGKGHAEMAVSRVKGSGPETPAQTPNAEAFPEGDFMDGENPYTNRRMSDPNAMWSNTFRSSFKRGNNIRKSRSETENVDIVGTNGMSEVEAGNIEDEFDESQEHYNGFWGKSFGQAWGWFKERKRANSVALHAFLTYVTLPWHRIIADVCEETEPLAPGIFVGTKQGSYCYLQS